MESSSSRGTRRGGIAWIDRSRGVAIFMVLFLHAASPLRNAGIEVPAFFTLVADAVAPFRTPMLMFLAGLFLERALAKGLGRHLDGTIRLLWPYLIWLVLFCLAVDPQKLTQPITYYGGSALWFLAFLILIRLVAVATWFAPPLVVALGTYGAALVWPDITTLQSKFLLMTSLFFLGACLGSRLTQATAFLQSPWALALIPILLGMGLYSATVENLKYDAPTFPLAVLGLIALLAIAERVPDSRLTRIFEHMGRRTLYYFLVHAPVMLPLQVLFLEIGLAPGLAVVLSLAAGLTACYGMQRLVQIYPRADLLFSAPWSSLRPASMQAGWRPSWPGAARAAGRKQEQGP
ncbi:MAG: acyltransferase [Pseudomonadota bacterium]